MAMGTTGTVNVSVKMFDDIKAAVETYRNTSAKLKERVEGEINGLVGKRTNANACNLVCLVNGNSNNLCL